MFINYINLTYYEKNELGWEVSQGDLIHRSFLKYISIERQTHVSGFSHLEDNLNYGASILLLRGALFILNCRR